MKKYIFYSGIVAILAASSACQNASNDAKKEADSTNTARIDSAKKTDTIAANDNHMADMKPDAKFATAAADGGMLEVELGKLASEKGVSPSIRKLGAMMVKDHSKANAELKATAAQKNIALPEGMSDKCQKTYKDLSEKSGADFDKAYADLMVDDHKEDIEEFKKEAEKGTDKDLMAWAQGKIPVLEHHLRMAEDAKKAVKK